MHFFYTTLPKFFSGLLRNKADGFSRPKNYAQSDAYLIQGTLYNQLNVYKDAIKILDHSIQLNSYNRDAYIERSLAYFETDQLNLALKDYTSAKKLSIQPPFKNVKSVYVPKEKLNFAKGLLAGTYGGSKIAIAGFIPSVCDCCTSICSGLWAFVCSPKEIGQELLDTAYAIGEFISEHSLEECLQCMVPELKELSLVWNNINDYHKGEKIGYIIGKYGTDIFIPLSAVKGVHKVNALRRANVMYTLECCASSEIKQTTIIQEAVERATLRASIANESAKKCKIFAKTSNVKYHVMQPKHAWDKVIQLTGDVEEDFKKVVLLLEREGILNKTYSYQSLEVGNGEIIRNDYIKLINDHKVRAVFETYVENNQTFLKDAWVITK